MSFKFGIEPSNSTWVILPLTTPWELLSSYFTSHRVVSEVLILLLFCLRYISFLFTYSSNKPEVVSLGTDEHTEMEIVLSMVTLCSELCHFLSHRSGVVAAGVTGKNSWQPSHSFNILLQKEQKIYVLVVACVTWSWFTRSFSRAEHYGPHVRCSERKQ